MVWVGIHDGRPRDPMRAAPNVEAVLGCQRLKLLVAPAPPFLVQQRKVEDGSLHVLPVRVVKLAEDL